MNRSIDLTTSQQIQHALTLALPCQDDHDPASAEDAVSCGT